jgi:AraC-like DNA-binding protein
MDEDTGSQQQSGGAAAEGAARGTGTTERRRNPELVRMLGLEPEDLLDPGKSMLSGGLQRLWATQRAMELPLKTEQEEEEEGRELTKEEKEELEYQRLKAIEDSPCCKAVPDEEPEAPPPLWRSMTGIFPENERAMSPAGRAMRLEEFVDVVMKLLRYEMEQEQAKPNIYHTVFWDPLPQVCFALGIARAQLTRLSREATGLSAHELVDAIRVEKVKEKMKEEVRKRIQNSESRMQKGTEGLTTEDAEDTEDGLKRKATVASVYAEIKKERKGPQFHRGVWALGFGFPNYLRFYRACLFYYRLAPQQLELVAIQEVLAEENGGETAGTEAGTTTAGTEAGATDGSEAEKKEEEARVREACAQVRARHVQFFTEITRRVWQEVYEGGKGAEAAAG